MVKHILAHIRAISGLNLDQTLERGLLDILEGVSGQLKMFFDRLRFTTYDPHKLKGPRRGILIVTYEDDKKKEYFETASQLANYFTWNDRGDFGKVRVVAESNLGPEEAWKSRPDLLRKLKKIGRDQARELIELRSKRHR